MDNKFDPLSDAPKSPVPFGMKERLITTLLFDTQPKRRAEFVKTLGYQLNPKDDNEIKPIGSDDHAYFPIDPGGVFNWNQYIKSGGVNGSEILKDSAEAVGDMIQGGMTEAAGIGGGIIGSAAGPIGATAGHVAGRAAMFNAIENMKDSIGNLFLDKNVPIDDALRATQTAVQGIAPDVLAKGGEVLKKAAVKSATLVSDGVRNLLNIGDGKIGAQAWQMLKTNPELVSNEKALREASMGIDDTVNHLLGRTLSGDSINNSVFSQKLGSLEAQRKVQSDILSQDPNNGAPLDKIIKFFEQKKMDLADQSKYPIHSQQRKDAIEYIDGKIGELKKLSPEQNPGSLSTGSENRLSFGQLDSVVKEIQSDLYASNRVGKDWRSAVKSIVDGSPDDPGLNNLLKQKATDAGSPYAQIKEQQSKIFKAYEQVKDNITPQNAKRFIIGDETLDPRGNSVDTVAKNFGDAVKATDEVLGTKIEDGLRTGQVQNQFWQAAGQKGARGSGGTTVPAMGAASVVGGSVAQATHSPALGAVAGGAAGLGTYALSQPKIGTRVAIGAENAAQKLSNIGPDKALGDYASQLGSQEAVQHIPESQDNIQTPPEEFDPLKDLKE